MASELFTIIGAVLNVLVFNNTILCFSLVSFGLWGKRRQKTKFSAGKASEGQKRMV